jgi:hypothetical protein
MRRAVEWQLAGSLGQTSDNELLTYVVSALLLLYHLHQIHQNHHVDDTVTWNFDPYDDASPSYLKEIS